MCKDFKYLDGLIHSEGEIVLESDIVLGEDEKLDYTDGIELDVDDLIIDGNGHTIYARGKTRIFKCTGENVTLKNITLKNGFSFENGGAIAIEEDGDLTIVESTFTENKSNEDGGAIFNEEGILIVKNSMFSFNTAEDFGGAINNWGELEVIESSFMNNEANFGAAIHNSEILKVIESSFDSLFMNEI